MYGPFSIKNISQESVWLQLFPLSLMGGSDQVVSSSTEGFDYLLGRAYQGILHKIFPSFKDDGIEGQYPGL